MDYSHDSDDWLRNAREELLRVAIITRTEASQVDVDRSIPIGEKRRRSAELRDTIDGVERSISEITAELESRRPTMNPPFDTRTADNNGGRYGLDSAPPETGSVLRSDQTMTDWARRSGLIPRDHETGERPLHFGRFVRGLATGNWTDADSERRAMSEGVLTGGGYLVPTVLSSMLIDLARPQARVLQAGATVVPMAGPTVNVAKWAGDPSPAWHTESSAITPSDATLSRVTLSAKTLACLVLSSRELLEDAEPNQLDDELRNAFAKQFALVLDSAALYGSGASGQPLGVKATSGVTLSPMGANGLAPTNYDFLVNAVYAVRANNEVPTACIYNPRTSKELALLKDSQLRTLEPPPYLDPIAFYETTQVPTNLTVGTGTTTSDAFVADWSQLLVGVRTNVELQTSGPQLQRLVERYAEFGQVGFLAWYRADIQVARAGAFNVVTGIL
jgi:HK97 family phage major capsid protein